MAEIVHLELADGDVLVLSVPEDVPTAAVVQGREGIMAMLGGRNQVIVIQGDGGLEGVLEPVGVEPVATDGFTPSQMTVRVAPTKTPGVVQPGQLYRLRCPDGVAV